MADELDLEAIMERCRRLWKESMDRGTDAEEVQLGICCMYHEAIRLRHKLRETEEAIETIRSAVGANDGESTVEAFYRGLDEVKTHMDEMVDAALGRSPIPSEVAPMRALAQRVEVAMEAKGVCWSDIYDRYGDECVHIVKSRLEEPALCPTLLEEVADMVGLDESAEIARLEAIWAKANGGETVNPALKRESP